MSLVGFFLPKVLIISQLQIRCFFFNKKTSIFLFLHKNISCGAYYKHLNEGLVMSTHNICFSGEIRKNIFMIAFLSEAMLFSNIALFF